MVDVKWARMGASGRVNSKAQNNINFVIEDQTNHQFGGGRTEAEAEKQPAFARRRVVVVVDSWSCAQLRNSSSFRFHVDLVLDSRRR